MSEYKFEWVAGYHSSSGMEREINPYKSERRMFGGGFGGCGVVWSLCFGGFFLRFARAERFFHLEEEEAIRGLRWQHLLSNKNLRMVIISGPRGPRCDHGWFYHQLIMFNCVFFHGRLSARPCDTIQIQIRGPLCWLCEVVGCVRPWVFIATNNTEGGETF